MAKAPQKTFIETTDVKGDLQPAVEAVAGVLNPFMEEVIDALDGKLDFDNLNMAKVTITVRVDSDGKPVSGSTMKNPLKLNKAVSGLMVIRAQNTKNSNSYPTGTPFISFQEASQIVTFKNITNLMANQDYKLTLLVF